MALATPITAIPTYQRREVPKDYDRGWVGVELNTIQRAIPSRRVRTFTATSTAFTDVPSVLDHTILYDSTAHAITVTLYPPDQVQGLELTLKRINGGANTVTITNTLDGTAGRTLSAQYKAFTIVSDGLTYYILASV